MTTLWTLTLRELKAFWYSPIAYAVSGLFLLLQGVVFTILLAVLVDPRFDPTVTTITQLFFGGTVYFWFMGLIIPSLLTMRAFSEETRSGTIEALLTAPVTETQVVLAKFLGAWLNYIALWASTAVFFLVLRRFLPFDWGPVLTGYLGTWLMGGVLIAVGVLASSLTRNQVIAAVLSFVAILLLFSIGILDVFVQDPEGSKMIQYFSLLEQLHGFSKGLIDTRPIVLYASIASIALFLTGRVISNPRWRS
ncbi:MAG: ABC transporter permease subunit [Candidatus Omnitrophica bacterium]|nr:ABC transporter permease subunit [Candidatus Omnitrophota bacterium]